MKTEIIAILDRSGSMSHLVADTLGGFNAYIDEQKKVDGECNVSLVTFGSEYTPIYGSTPLDNVVELTTEQYRISGMTAMNDAIGKATVDAGQRFAAMNEADRPEKVIVLIITDGAENSSREYSQSAIKAMITEQENKYSWEYVFLGANIDTKQVASNLGMKMSNVATYSDTAIGTADAYRGFAAKSTSLRGGELASACVMSDIVKTDDQRSAD